MHSLFQITRIPPLLLCTILIFSCAPDEQTQSERSQERKQTYLKDYRSPDARWGFLHRSGKTAIEPRFDEVRSFKEGIAVVDEKGLWGAIDTSGAYVIPPEYKGLTPPKNGFLRATNFGGKSGFLSPTGDTMIPFRYHEVRNFNEGKAAVAQDGKWGFIDASGNTVLPLSYSSVGDFNGGYAIITTRNGSGLIDGEGNELISPRYESLKWNDHPLLAACRGIRCGYIDRREKTRIPFQYHTAAPFRAGRAVVSDEQGFFLIDSTGRTVMDAHYPYLKYNKDGRWMALQQDTFYLLDESGKRLIDRGFQTIYPFSESLAAFRENGLWGYIDRNGQTILEPEYGLAWTFENGLARAAFRGGIALIDTTGGVIIPPYFEDVRLPSEGFIPFKESVK